MENKLSFTLMLSLKEMALRKIAVVLMNQPDILATTEKLYLPNIHSYKSDWFETIKKKITYKVSKLSLPESLTRQIIPILKAVGTEILKWNFFHKEFLKDSIDDFDLHAVEKLCWTTAGTVDYRRTAENLAFSDAIDVEKRFKLTCLYCLDHCIPEVWQELSEESKRTFFSEVGISPRVRIPFRFRKFILKKLFDYRGWNFVFVNPFKQAILLGHTTLAEYYLGELSKEERDASLVQIAIQVVRQRDPHLIFSSKITREKFSDVLCFLLSLMTPEEQMQVIKELPCEVLRCFLDWPWQDFFLDIADIVWTFLPESKYKYLLIIIRNFMSSGYYFPNILQELFLRCPRNFRKCFVNFECCEASFLLNFFHAEDSETIRVIFRNIEPADRIAIVFSKPVFYVLDDSILKDRWCVIKAFIREAALSKEDRARWKRDFSKYLKEAGNSWRVKGKAHKRRRFFEFLDGMDASPADKRRPEDETLTKVKKSRKAKKL